MNYEYNLYNRINLLSFDIENALDQEENDKVHKVMKLFYYFNHSGVNGKYVKPFLIRAFITTNNEANEGNDLVEIQWGVNDLFSRFNKLPMYQLHTNTMADYNYIDIKDKQFSVKNDSQIAKFTKFEDEAYEFEIRKGNVLLTSEETDRLFELLEINEIDYDCEYDDDGFPCCVIMFPKTKNQVYISLNGRINKSHKNEILPKINENYPFISLGKFNVFNGKLTQLPNEDNLALIAKCNYCHCHMIHNWWSMNGTRCQQCCKLNKLSIC